MNVFAAEDLEKLPNNPRYASVSVFNFIYLAVILLDSTL